MAGTNICFHGLMLYFVVMQVACRSHPDDPEAQKAVDLLYNTALISSGFTVSTSPNHFGYY